MFQEFSLGIERNKKTANINVKNDVYKNGYRRRSCTSKTAKIHRFVRFVMYCIITTCSVECHWHCSDGTVHYKSDKTVNFCGFRCATTSPIAVFINVVFTFIIIHNHYLHMEAVYKQDNV